MDGYSACSQAIGGDYCILSFSTIAAQMGPAVLVTEDSRLLQLWLRVVETLPSTVHQGLLFPSFDGKPLSHLERVVGWAAAKHGHTLPNATSFRKELESSNQRRLSGTAKEAVSRSLSHSSDTAAQYYQAPSMGDCLHTFSTIQCLIGDRDAPPDEDCTTSTLPPHSRKGTVLGKGKGKGRRAVISPSRSPSSAGEGRRAESTSPTPQGRGKNKGRRAIISQSPSSAVEGRSPSSSPTPQKQMGKRPRSPVNTSVVRHATTPFSPHKRRKFSQSETAAVTNYFGDHLKKGHQPSLGECREFLDTYKFSRSAKNIQDKVRNLLKH